MRDTWHVPFLAAAYCDGLGIDEDWALEAVLSAFDRKGSSIINSGGALDLVIDRWGVDWVADALADVLSTDILARRRDEPAAAYLRRIGDDIWDSTDVLADWVYDITTAQATDLRDQGLEVCIEYLYSGRSVPALEAHLYHLAIDAGVDERLAPIRLI